MTTAAALEDVHRYDLASGVIKSHRETPQGGYVVHANLTRTGVFHYPQPDGTVRRELRHPDEVFDRDSLDSLKHSTITVEHPQRVTPTNWKDVAVGHVADVPKRDGRFVAGDIAVQHGPAMRDVDKGKLEEVSCGYVCQLDPTPGTFNGEKYDAIQRKIRYNHVALLPRGAGRAGPEVRLHLDGTTSMPESEDGGPSYVRRMAGEKTVEEKLADLTARADALEATNKTLVAEAAALKAAPKSDPAVTAELERLRVDSQRLAGENAALRAQTEGANKERKDRQEIEAFDAAVAERTQILSDAKRVLGARWDGQGKSSAQIKREVLAKLTPRVTYDGKDANFVEGAYAIAIEGGRAQRQSFDDVADLSTPFMTRDGKAKPADDEPDEDDKEPKANAAYDAMVARDQGAWKKKRDKGASARH